VDGDAAAIVAAAADYVNGAAKYELVPEKLNSRHRCVIVMLHLVIKLRLPFCDILQKHSFRYTSNTCSFDIIIHFFFIYLCYLFWFEHPSSGI